MSKQSKPNIDQLIEATIDSASNINAVKTSPFFKEKVLNNIAKQDIIKNADVGYLNWFTPSYQAAALVFFVILNAYVLVSNNSDNSDVDTFENFADVYGLSETTTDSYLYQN